MVGGAGVIVLALDEFTAKRRPAQTAIEERLRPVVEKAVDLSTDTSGWDDLLSKVSDIYFDVYQDEAGDVPRRGPSVRWREDLRETLRKTKKRDEHSVEAITIWLATAILTRATLDASADDPEDLFVEWVDMGDAQVRHAHKVAAGQVRPVGEKFEVGSFEMEGPGDPSVPIELWINCRCTLRPTLASEALVASEKFRDVSTKERKKDADAGRAMPDGSYPIDNCSDLKNAVQAIGRAKDPEKVKAHIRKRKNALGCPDVELPWAEEESVTASTEAERNASTVVVALPPQDHPVNEVGSEQKHVTLAFLGDYQGDPRPVHEAVARIASEAQPFEAAVSGHGMLGPDKAKVAFVEHSDIQSIRNRLMDDPDINSAVSDSDSHPHFVPHMTIGYDESDPSETEFSSIPIDRLAVWHGEEQTEYALGAEMPETEKPDGAPPEKTVAADARVPWHGILAPEGVRSGDGRRFMAGALSTRPLPLPLTWQKSSSEGHGGSVVVATIEKAEVVDGLMRGSGYMLSSPEADEVIGLIGEFGQFGVSVDADEAEYELNEDDETVDFSNARVCGASIVPIPAFAEAWVALGHWDDEDVTDPVDPEEMEPALRDRALAASLTAMREKVQVFKDLAPGKTEDGPGWLTHPVDTDRLRDYWVRGEGAAKIGWGSPGDFNRCRVAVAEYVKPQYLNGYCANRHYDALGFWPGRPVAGDTTPFAAETMELESTDPAPAVSLVAAAVIKAPAAWFQDPQFAANDGRMAQDQKDGTWGCPVTVTDEGHVFGHIAKWDVCHIGYGEFCQTAPHSTSNYSYFLTGQVRLDDGTSVSTGPLTIGGGHAGGRLGLRAAIEHYDKTSTAVCDVTVGEDQFGIWFSGWVRPGVTDEMVTALLASPLSGDWRTVGGELEMIAALAVNTPGFRVPRPRVAAGLEGQVSLVAAGVVTPDPGTRVEQGVDLEALGLIVARQIMELTERKAEMAALAERVNEKAGV